MASEPSPSSSPGPAAGTEAPFEAGPPTSRRRVQGGTLVTAVFARLTELQLRHPWLLMLVAVLSVAAAGVLASRLTLKTSFGELLPENKESVLVADQVNERLPAMSTLSVVVEGSDNQGLERFVNALVVELSALGPELVGGIDYGIQATRAFYEEHKLLFAPLELVRSIRDDVIARWNYEVGQASGSWVDDDYVPPKLSEETIRKRVEEHTKQAGGTAAERYPDGYYLDAKNHVIVVLVRTPISSGDLVQSAELQRRVRDAIARVGLPRFDAKAKAGLGGDLLTSAETYEQIRNDLSHVGVWGVSLILGVVFLFYLRLRTLAAMGLTVGIGTAWTFGLAYLLIGHLNSATGFLVSIVVGNGINFGIIYMARYLEERRTQELRPSLLAAHRDTWLSTLTASAAATAAYGSLAITDFRGFKHFGVIGGTGMLLCWIATFLFMPAILVLFEKAKAIRPASGRLERLRGYYGRPFAWLAGKAPRSIVVVAAALTLGASVLTVRYLRQDPMEYEMRNIDNDPELKRSEARRLVDLADDIVGRQGQDGLAIAVDRLDQVLPLKAELDKQHAAAPADHKPFDQVVTIYSLLPTDQEEKIRLVREALAIIERAHRKGFISAEERQRVADFVGEKELRPIGIDDLPTQVAASFTEKDGTRGRLVYIVPATGRSVWDGRYLIEWADSFRRTTLPDGSVVRGSGRSVIFADMILAIREDAPKALLVSLVATLAIVLVSFRARRGALGVIGAVLVGLAWTVATLAVWNTAWPWQEGGKLVVQGLKLNFLNFVALPITIGIGADYAVNVMQRYRIAGGRNIREVVIQTGGAVILCALTTMLGYVALTLSVNRAIRSFGIAAAVGEVSCLLLGVLVLPAALVWLASRRERTAARTSAQKL